MKLCYYHYVADKSYKERKGNKVNVNLLKVLANTKETAELIEMLADFKIQLDEADNEFAVGHAENSIEAIKAILEERGVVVGEAKARNEFKVVDGDLVLVTFTRLDYATKYANRYTNETLQSLTIEGKDLLLVTRLTALVGA